MELPRFDRPVSAVEALRAVELARAPESAYEGFDRLTIAPSAIGAGKPEFGDNVAVFFVNGIATNISQEIRTASDFADRIHGNVNVIHASTAGMVEDLAGVSVEKESRAYAFSEKPVRDVAREVLDRIKTVDGNVEMAQDVHFAAHSRGALIVQRGLELAERDLLEAGYTERQIHHDVFSHVSVETFGGASFGMPSGIRTLNYVDSHDGVSAAAGVGPLRGANSYELALAEVALPAASVPIDTLLAEKFAQSGSRAPIVDVPVAPGSTIVHPIDDLFERNHNVAHYLQYRAPFEATYAVSSRPIAEALPTRDRVQAGVDRLTESGKRLPDVTSLEHFSGLAQIGSFVDVDDKFVAQHGGQGAYTYYHVEDDLAGARPPQGVVIATHVQDGIARWDELIHERQLGRA